MLSCVEAGKSLQRLEMPPTFLEMEENMWLSCQEVLVSRQTGAAHLQRPTTWSPPTESHILSFLSHSIYNCSSSQDVSTVCKSLILKFSEYPKQIPSTFCHKGFKSVLILSGLDLEQQHQESSLQQLLGPIFDSFSGSAWSSSGS